MVYKQYTMKGNRGVLFGWRCPKCGKLNLASHTVSAASTYDDRGFRVSLDNRKAKAEQALNDSLDKRAMNAVLDVENGRFDKVRLQAKCAECGDSPAWANLPPAVPKWFTYLRNACAAAAVMLLFVGFFSNGDKPRQMYGYALIAGALFVALLAAGIIIGRIRYAGERPAIEALAPECLPHMALSGPELIRRMNEDGMLTAEEAGQMGVTPIQSSQSSPFNLSSQYKTAAEERRKSQRTKGIAVAVVAALAVAGIGYLYVNGENTKKWQAVMEAADLFTADAQAGDRIAVYDSHVSGKYVKKYVSEDRLAQTPEEAGYIVEIRDRTEVVGTYGSSIGIKKNAYKVYTEISLYDRHTGRYVGDTITLAGGDPPKSIKSTQASGTGGRPSSYDITNAVSKLIAQIDAD